jgi:hypothetical protein
MIKEGKVSNICDLMSISFDQNNLTGIELDVQLFPK